jgi:hypothetical protein
MLGVDGVGLVRLWLYLVTDLLLPPYYVISLDIDDGGTTT